MSLVSGIFFFLFDVVHDHYDQLRPTTAILTLYVSLLGLGVDVVRLFPWCSLLSAPALVASVGIQ